jgi:hypothetical protein
MEENQHGVVFCENWTTDRSEVAQWAWPPPHIAWLNRTELYSVLTSEVTDPELMEAALPRHLFGQNAVCATCSCVPVGEIQSEAYFDEIVQRTDLLIVPAFDGEGYLVWSLALSDSVPASGED